MKYVIMVLVVLFACSTSFAETSIALKEGYTFYKESGESEYVGNNVMDNEMSSGAYLRIVKGKTIYRLDYDALKTGNTFTQPIPKPYESVDFETKPIVVSYGKYLTKSIYLLGGVGYSLNTISIEEYITDKFDYAISNSPCLALTLGIEKNLDKHLYFFSEVRYLYNKASIDIAGTTIKEDLSNLGVNIGIGFKF
jgi:hypothetical protein